MKIKRVHLGEKGSLDLETLDIDLGIRFYIDDNNYIEVKPSRDEPNISIRVCDGYIIVLPRAANLIEVKLKPFSDKE